MIPATMPTYARIDLTFERGQGAHLFDSNGRRYLDFGSGIAVTAFGHGHPHIVAALTGQAERPWHVSNLYRIAEQERLGERLVDATFADTVFFGNSGAEALECGIKLIRKYHDETGQPGRFRIITFEGAFHGRTLATISAGMQAKHIVGFGPLLDGFDQVPFGDIEAARAAVGPATAGILIEPIQGETGINVAPDGFLKALRQLADEHGLLLFFDEVQCGMGRTGRLFAHEWESVTPDVMASAKALGAGFPIGACLATEKAAVGMVAGTHGSTFGGNLLACAVGNAVLDLMLADGFLNQVEARAAQLRERLKTLARSNTGVIEEVRGRGLMLGLKCSVPNTDLIEAARREGLLVVIAADNVVRLLPPLNLEESHIEEAMDILHRVCAELA